MSFMPEDAPEFEEIRQCHDAWIKRSRLELMAETGHADGAPDVDGECTGVERHADL